MATDVHPAIDSLSLVSGFIYRMARYEARDLGIRWTALMVLRDLALLGPMSQRTLASIEQVTEPTMTVLIQQMQARGLITRGRTPNNRSRNDVAISIKGRRALKDAGIALRQRLASKLVGVTGPELDAVDAALQPVARLLLAAVSPPPEEP